MKVLVTGATGVLGNYIIKYLRKANIQDIAILTRSGKKPILLEDENLEIIKGDILDINAIYDATEGRSVVIHAAAEVSFSPKDKANMYKINIEGTANVVNACLENEVSRLIHVSSIAAIGRNEKSPVVNEETEWVEDKLNSDYAITKYKGELEVWRGFAEGLNGAIVNPSVIMGAGDWSRSSLAMWKKVEEGLPFYPTGATAVVDVRDVAKFITKMVTSCVNHERFILGGTNVTFQKLFTKMSESIHVKAPVKPLKDWMGEIFWRLEYLRTKISGKTPIVTKATTKTAKSTFQYDSSKSKTIEDFDYIPFEQTMEECGKIYRTQKAGLLPII